MKKKLLLIIGITAVILSGCGSSFSKEELNKAFFDIVEKINAEEYDAALTDLEKYYEGYDYSSEEGFNKANLYTLYYDKQGMYDEEMTVSLDYLKAHDLKNNIEDNEDMDEKLNMEVMISKTGEILDKVSPEKKEEAVNLIGEQLLEKYSAKGAE